MAERMKNEEPVKPAGRGPMGKGPHRPGPGHGPGGPRGMMAAPGMKLEKGTIPRLLTYLA